MIYKTKLDYIIEVEYSKHNGLREVYWLKEKRMLFLITYWVTVDGYFTLEETQEEFKRRKYGR